MPFLLQTRCSAKIRCSQVYDDPVSQPHVSEYTRENQSRYKVYQERGEYSMLTMDEPVGNS